MKQAPQRCRRHDMVDPTCATCVAYLRWNSPAITLLGYRNQFRSNKNMQVPCPKHATSSASCHLCEQWQDIERKAARKAARFARSKAEKKSAKLAHRLARTEREQRVRGAHEEALRAARRANIKPSQATILSGYVYAIENPAFPGWVKIGKAASLSERLSSYQTSDPHRAYRTLASKLVPDRDASEKARQRLMASYPRQGEWFYTKADSVIGAFANLR